jgi:NTE family protein
MAELTKVAVACQGGGMHAAFTVGVLDEILKDLDENNRFELVGLSGTSAGALCALMVWYGLAKKNGKSGSPQEARDALVGMWDNFVVRTFGEFALNALTYGSVLAEEQELPFFGVSAPMVGLNPYSWYYNMVAASLPYLDVRKQYFDLDYFLDQACPEFDRIDWNEVKTRLLVGASEVVNGFETVFDSNVNKYPNLINKGKQRTVGYWCQRLPLTLPGVAASGTLPAVRQAESISGKGDYWDGLYSYNPPVNAFFFEDIGKTEKPDELWVIRINPQQRPGVPDKHKDIQDRENELMGNLSLNKELDFILQVNDWLGKYKCNARDDDRECKPFDSDFKEVTVRTIKMTKKSAFSLLASSKVDRSRNFMVQLRAEGREVAHDWLDKYWNGQRTEYPKDAGY